MQGTERESETNRQRGTQDIVREREKTESGQRAPIRGSARQGPCQEPGSTPGTRERGRVCLWQGRAAFSADHQSTNRLCECREERDTTSTTTAIAEPPFEAISRNASRLRLLHRQRLTPLPLLSMSIATPGVSRVCDWKNGVGVLRMWATSDCSKGEYALK